MVWVLFVQSVFMALCNYSPACIDYVGRRLNLDTLVWRPSPDAATHVRMLLSDSGDRAMCQRIAANF